MSKGWAFPLGPRPCPQWSGSLSLAPCFDPNAVCLPQGWDSAGQVGPPLGSAAVWGLLQATAVPESDVNCGVQSWLLHSAVEASGMSSFPTPPLSSPVQNSANKVYFKAVVFGAAV